MPAQVAVAAGMEGAQGVGKLPPGLAGAGDVDDGLEELAFAAPAAAVVGERTN